MNKSAIH